MPDIDIDFCYERRQEVIDYVVRKYGKDQGSSDCNIWNHEGNVMQSGMLARALDLPYAYVDSVAKMIPNDLQMTLELTINGALKVNRELLAMILIQMTSAKYLIDMSKKA